METADLNACADLVRRADPDRFLAAMASPVAARSALFPIYAFNVESEAELAALNDVAVQKGKTARIAFRVNPDIDPKTHKKISTGKAEDKFGVPFAHRLR